MPISKSDLKALFNHLDEKLGGEDCNHMLNHTSAFLDERGLPRSLVLDWAARQGGSCDCEVLANVESDYEGLLNKP